MPETSIFTALWQYLGNESLDIDKIWYVIILDQTTTLLFYKFFTLCSEKIAFLVISRKDPHEIFYKIFFH